MATLQLFFEAFWPAFLVSSLGLSLRWFFGLSTSKASPIFIVSKSLPELAALTTVVQKQVLNQVTREAFQGGRWLLVILIFSAILASGVALGYVLPLVTAFPHSIWAWLAVAALFAGFGGWMVGRWERRRVSRVLKKWVERQLSSQLPKARRD